MSTVFNNSIVFTFEAWTKLNYMCSSAVTEIGGFGISHKNDPFLITDFVLVPQECTLASVDFDDEGLADHMDNMMEKGIIPARSFRHWIHTHPGNSAAPSSTDWKSWGDCFPNADWSTMIILAKGGDSSGHMRSKVSVGEVSTVVTSKLKVEYYDIPDGPCLIDPDRWDQELKKNVAEKKVVIPQAKFPKTYYGNLYAKGGLYGMTDAELKEEAEYNNSLYKKGELE